jgi:hypothetical protein
VADSLLSARFRADGDTSTADWNRSGDESASTIAELIRQQAVGSSFERTNFWQNMSGGNLLLIYDTQVTKDEIRCPRILQT